MKHALLLSLLLFGSSAFAVDTAPPAPTLDVTPVVDVRPTLSAYAGAATIWTGEHWDSRKELIAARVTAVFPTINDHLYIAAQGEMRRDQDGSTVGGTADPRDYRDFRLSLAATVPLLEVLPGVVCGPSAVVGQTYSWEGTVDAPPDPRQSFALAGARCGDKTGSRYAYALIGKYGPVGDGWKSVAFAFQVPIHGGPLNAVGEGVPFGEGRTVMVGFSAKVPLPSWANGK